MPESAMDRPSSALEYVFLLSKSQKYFFDMDAIKVKYKEPLNRYGGDTKKTSENLKIGSPHAAAHRERDMRPDPNGRNFRNTDLFFESLTPPFGMIFCDEELVGIDVNPKGFKESHFATFPEALITPMILSGTSEKGCCPDCGSPWERIIEKEIMPPPDRINNNPFKHDLMTNHGDGASTLRNIVKSNTVSWHPTCTHISDKWPWVDPPDPIPCVVADIFAGAGTVPLVSEKYGRRWVAVELSPEYCKMIKKRLKPETSQRKLF